MRCWQGYLSGMRCIAHFLADTTATPSGSEPSSVEADVYVWRYALLVVYSRKEEVRRCRHMWIHLSVSRPTSSVLLSYSHSLPRPLCRQTSDPHPFNGLFSRPTWVSWHQKRLDALPQPTVSKHWRQSVTPDRLTKSVAIFILTMFITFHASRRRRKMYCGHARLCVCLSVHGRMPTLLHRSGCNLAEW